MIFRTEMGGDGATAENRVYHRVLEAADDACAILELVLDDQGRAADARLLEVNPAFNRHTGLGRPVGRTLRELVPDLPSSWMHVLRLVAQGRGPLRFGREVVSLQRWFEGKVISLDESDRHLALLFRHVPEGGEIAPRPNAEQPSWRHRALQLLSEAGTQLLLHDQPSQLIGPLCDQLAESLRLDVILSYVADEPGRSLRLHTSRGIGPDERDLLQILACDEALCGPVDELREATILDASHEPPEVPGGLMRGLGMAAYACLPLSASGPLLGTLSFGRRHGGPFRTEEVALACAVAERISSALHLEHVLAARARAEEQLREHQARLEEALRVAEAAAKAKDHFLATLSHELRTPLTPVLMVAAEGAADAALPPEVRQSFQIVRKNVELEARLIDDLLDLTRITRGKMPLDRRLVDVHDILRDAITIVRGELAEKGIVVRTQFKARVAGVDGDPTRLQQIFWNILRNSAKFTPKGGCVTLETDNTADARGLIIRISDTGIGLTGDELARVFTAFTQGEHAEQRPGAHAFGGLGLGLAISQRLAEMHGGRIAAHSGGRGHGATFMVELPLAAAGVRGGVTPPADRRGNDGAPAGGLPGGLHILLIEDHASTRQALAMLLRRRHHCVSVAATGEEALALVRSEAFDLVISDIGLPDIDGHALLGRLRAVQPGLLAIALSGWGMEEDLRRSSSAGFSRHLVKPVAVPKLEEAIEGALAMRAD